MAHEHEHEHDGEASPAQIVASHLFVLEHGLHGSDQDFTNFEKLLTEHLQQEDVHVHCATSNAASFFQTYDGIDSGGERLADEIQELAKRMPNLKKLSLLGHSLGGLYNRYCIGVLFARGFFTNVEPVNFITMATPHLGIRRPQRGSVNFLYNSLTKKLFHRTGQQFFLRDSANELTHSLSMNSLPNKEDLGNAQGSVQSDREGTLLICMNAMSGGGELYEYYYCTLSDQMLRLYEIENHGVENFSAAGQKSLVEIDLLRADVTLELPHRPARPKHGKKSHGNLFSGLLSLTRRSRSSSSASHQSSASGRLSDPDHLEVSHEPYEITIRWTSTTLNEMGKQRKCVIRIPSEEIDRDWKWLVAFSNNSFGMRCLTKHSDGASRKKAKEDAEVVDAPPLLCCMARGQFVQALLLFKTRTLYSNVFFDLQVPYSCASIRAFNPYRMETTKRSTSPVYPHITLYSIGSAPLLRDTLTAEIRLQLSSKHGPVRFFSQDGHRKRLSLTGGVGGSTSSLPANFESEHDSNEGNRYTVTDEMEFSRRSTASSASFGGDGTRSDPFVDGEVIVDRVHEAFSSDDESDALRAMLITLQSVGWRRIDVMFDNVLAHEKIIAKRATPSKLSESGIDVVYHVMNSFVA